MLRCIFLYVASTPPSRRRGFGVPQDYLSKIEGTAKLTTESGNAQDLPAYRRRDFGDSSPDRGLTIPENFYGVFSLNVLSGSCSRCTAWQALHCFPILPD